MSLVNPRAGIELLLRPVAAASTWAAFPASRRWVMSNRKALRGRLSTRPGAPDSGWWFVALAHRLGYVARMTLREQVEELLPGWRTWYPSLFDAAADLGLIRARVCSPDSLLLSTRHARVRTAAEAAHRERWGGGPADDNG